MTPKSVVKWTLRSLGYEIRKLPKDRPLPNDQVVPATPFDLQKALLTDQVVQTVFDVGANIGVTVSEYERLFPKARIYCFEPFEECFSTLRGTYKNSDRIKPYKLAITDRSGTGKLFFNKNNGTNSLLPVAGECGKYVDANEMRNLGSMDVQTTTLDNFCLNERIERIQILKIDIQGGELMAFRGATGLLNMQRIDLLYSEVLFVPLYEKQAYFCDLYEFLDQYGYTLYGLYNLNYGRNGVLSWADAIFISSKIEETLARQ